MRALSLGLAVVLFLLAAPARAVYQCGPQKDDCQCGGNNPYPCCDNGGNCTWWAWEAACCNWARALPGWGNANQWAGNARANGGYRVESWPVVGAVSCRASGQYGHVAYVIGLNGAGVRVSEQNCWGNYGMREWDYANAAWWDGGFITPNGRVQCRPGDSQTQACGACGSQSRGCGSNGAWGAWGACQADEACEATTVLQGSAWIAPTRSSDVNGDKKADVCGRDAAGLQCFLSTGTGWTEEPGLRIALSDASGWGANQYWSTLRMGDLDGDGKADVCARAAAGIRCWISQGKSWSPVDGPEWSDAMSWARPEYYTTLRLGDVDGDGKDDLCARAASGIICHLSNGKGFGAQLAGPAWSDAQGYNHPKYYGTLRMADLDGDGKADLCIRDSGGVDCRLSDGKGFPTRFTAPALSDASGWGNLQYWATLRLVDVNGDGRADLCARSSAALDCYLSNGKGFGAAVQVAALSDANGWNDPSNFLTLRDGRVGGGRAADLCLRANAAVTCYRWNGKSFDAIAGPAWSDASGWGNAQHFQTLRLGDFDRDGKDDLCARAAAGFLCVPSTGTGFGAAVQLPGMTNAGGWDKVQYFGTILMGGPTCVPETERCNQQDDDCDGQVDEGGVCDPGPDAGHAGRDASEPHGTADASVSSERDAAVRRDAAGLVDAEIPGDVGPKADGSVQADATRPAGGDPVAEGGCSCGSTGAGTVFPALVLLVVGLRLRRGRR